MKKRIFSFLLVAVMISVASCGERAVPSYDSPAELVEKLCDDGIFSRSDIISEPLDNTAAYLFRMNPSDFDKNVKNGIVARQMVDTSGRLLYVFEMKTEDAAMLFAEDHYNHYEFPACDNAEKLVILTAGKYALFFKSFAAEAKAVKSAFRRYSGGKLALEEEIENKA